VGLLLSEKDQAALQVLDNPARLPEGLSLEVLGIAVELLE
jgi:hypothetical protein